MLNNYTAEKCIVGSLLHGMKDRMPLYLEKGITEAHFTDGYCKRAWKLLKESFDKGRDQDALNLDRLVLDSGSSDAKEFAIGLLEIRSCFQGDSYEEMNLKDLSECHFNRQAYTYSSKIQKECEKGDADQVEKLMLELSSLTSVNSKINPLQNPQNLRNSKAFPSEAFPPAMRNMIKEVSKSSLVPESLAAMVALGVISTAAGGGVNIRSLGMKTLNANLFILAIAKSGTGKGMTYSAMAKPLTDSNLEKLEYWKSQVAPSLQAEIELTEGKLKAEKSECVKNNKSDARYKELHVELARLNERLANDEPRLIAGETTEQKLGMLISGQPHEAIGNHSAEARGLIQIILGKFTGNATGETIYLAGYSGDPYSIERAGRADISLINPCVSCLFMIQPDVITELISKDSMSQSGFLPRFIMADVKAEIQDEPATPHSIASETSNAWGALVNSTIDTYRHAEQKITIEVASEAQKILREDINNVRSKGRVGAELDDLTSYVARYGENLRKIALLLHIGEHAMDAHNHPLSKVTAKNACIVSSWFFDESLAILRSSQIDKWLKLKTRLMMIVKGSGGQETLRQLRDRHSIHKEEVEMIMSMLPGDIEIIVSKNPKGGRPSELVKLID